MMRRRKKERFLKKRKGEMGKRDKTWKEERIRKRREKKAKGKKERKGKKKKERKREKERKKERKREREERKKERKKEKRKRERKKERKKKTEGFSRKPISPPRQQSGKRGLLVEKRYTIVWSAIYILFGSVVYFGLSWIQGISF